MITFAHIGDLHLTAPAADNARDVRAVVDEIAAVDDLDFNRNGRRW